MANFQSAQVCELVSRKSGAIGSHVLRLWAKRARGVMHTANSSNSSNGRSSSGMIVSSRGGWLSLSLSVPNLSLIASML